MFAEAAAANSFPVHAMFGMRGLGTLAGAENPNAVLIGTQLTVKANIWSRLTQLNVLWIDQGYLDEVSNWLSRFGYVVLDNSSDYSEVTISVEVRVEKNSIEGVIQDFSNALDNPIGRLGPLREYEVQNVHVVYPIDYNPREHMGTPSASSAGGGSKNPTPSGTPGAGGRDTGSGDKITKDPNAKPKGFLETLQAFFDSKFGFLGGTISGAALILVGAGVLFFVKNK